jgi:hypothetical protein
MQDQKLKLKAKRPVAPVVPSPARSVTIKDLAAELDLSITTISRALNGYSDVGEETRKRVAEAAREMGYRPVSVRCPTLWLDRVGNTGLVSTYKVVTITPARSTAPGSRFQSGSRLRSSRLLSRS